MSRFNADEVFALAEKIEENGASFYRRAAALRQSARKSTALLLELAAMEDRHKAAFATMRESWSGAKPDRETLDYLDATLYLNGMADAHGGEGNSNIPLSARTSLPDILRIAIGLEQKSIAFYAGLRDMVPARLGRNQIDRIIDEEKAHVVTLTRALRDAT